MPTTLTCTILAFAFPLLLSLLIPPFFLSTSPPYNSNHLLLPAGASGPESIVFDPLDGQLYTGVSDGRVLKWNSTKLTWNNFAVTSPARDRCDVDMDELLAGRERNFEDTEHICGRPLGLRFNRSGSELYIADPNFGLMKVGRDGGLASSILTHVNGAPLTFTNSLDIDHSNDVVYFTHSSSTYNRRDHTMAILTGDSTGRLIKYDLRNNEVQVLADNLGMANGVELSADGTFLLVAETLRCRVLRYWIKTERTGKLEVFADLPGFPDNVKKSPRGGYWIAIHSMKGRLVEFVLRYPSIGNAIARHCLRRRGLQSLLVKLKRKGMLIRLDESGAVIETVEGGKLGRGWNSISEGVEWNSELLVGSINMPFVGKFKLKKL